MIGRDSGGDVFFQTFAAQAGGVAVDRLAALVRGANLGHHVGIVVQHAGKVHHLRKVFDLRIVEQLGHFGRIEHGPGLVERTGRHAA